MMALIVDVLLLVCSVISVKALLEECPPFESTLCSCVIKWGPAVTCSKIKDVKTLDTTLQALKGYALDDLILSEVELPKLTSDTFQTLHINRLILNELELSSTDVIQFKGLEKTMKILVIDNSFKKKAIPNLKLDELENLESFMMMNNNLEEVSNEWFAGGPKKLFTILLQRNGIKRVGDKVFQSLDDLQTLWLTGNSLSQISRSMFPSNAKVLEKIDLSNNKIKEIPMGLFSEMPELTFVNLAGNLLQTFSEDRSFLKKTHIYVEGNPLKCSDGLGWICKNKVTLNVYTATCDSPDLMKGYSLKVFCDIHSKGENS